MEKNIILAVILSTIVLIVSFVIQGLYFTPPVTQTGYPPSEVSGQDAHIPDSLSFIRTSPSTSAAVLPDKKGNESDILVQRISIETELLSIALTNVGGDIVSYKLKNHKDGDGFVEMVLSGINEAHAFNIAFGSLNAQPLTSLFYVEQESEYSVTFYRDFFMSNDETSKFRLIKKYEFMPNDYMFELKISLDGGFTVPGFNFGGSAYTLSFGPQIGPRFEKLDNRYDYRHYFTYTNGKRRTEKANDSNTINTSPKWAAVSGKYFAFIAIPLLVQYEVNFSERAEPGLASTSRLNIIRPTINSSRVDDTYRFYLGPKSQEALSIYNTGNNSFGLIYMQLTELASSRGILSPLEKFLKWLLQIFYKIIPNYGVAIILLTLLVKIAFFPLTRKSFESTLRMQAVAPKIKELQGKYKDNSQKLNMEMAELYKKEGYNPLSGCLPMLLQLPLFFAMYNLFNNHFDLRGAMFISGWIPDLSLPESFYNFPGGFKLPLLGWTALRLLPFIYVGSQLLYGKVTQMPDQQKNAQSKMMLYVMPVIFFFVLYNVPSGLLIYWILSNVFTMLQQVVINKYLANRN